MRILAGHDERTQVGLARAPLPRGRIDHVDVLELDDLLRDETARVVLDLRRQLLAFRLVEVTAEDHAVTARLGHVLDDEFAHAVENLLAVLLEHRHVGGRVVQDWLLVQVILDHARYEVVDGLVVGRAVAGRVDDRHVAGAVGGQQSRHADHRIRVERERVEEVVGEAAVDDAHAMTIACIIQEEQLVLHHFEILGEGERRTGLLGQIRVLEERGVVTPRREHHGDAFGGDEIHRLAQQTRVVAVVAHVHFAEQARIRAPFDVAREQRVTRARRDAQIVLQHPPTTILALHEVLAGDVREHPAGRRHAVDLRIVAGGRVHEFLGYDAVMDDALLRIDVLQVGVERVDTLLETSLQLVELIRFDDARNRIVGEQTILVDAVLMHAEAHAVAAQFAVDPLTPRHQFRRKPARRRFNHRATFLVMGLSLRTRLTVRNTGFSKRAPMLRTRHFTAPRWFRASPYFAAPRFAALHCASLHFAALVPRPSRRWDLIQQLPH